MSFDMKLLSCFFVVLKALKKTFMENQVLNIDRKKIESLPKSSLEKLKDDYDLMLDFAIKRGIRLPKIVIDNSNLDNNEIVDNYNELVEAVKPATVESIAFTNENIFNNDFGRKWYQIATYKKSLVIALLALISIMGVSLSEKVNEELLSKSLLESSGTDLLLILIFICSSALLGVMFYSLKTINNKIKSYTITQADVLELDSKILIGVISGFLLSEAFSGFFGSVGDFTEITKMTLAILGGFSSDALFSILEGILRKIKALFE